MEKEVVLTGDRPTGPLHVGHYVGSLAQRLVLQDTHTQYVMIADMQALTDNWETPAKVHDNILEVMSDYCAIGLDPQKTTFFIQSAIPEIAQLALFYLNLVTVERLRRNPTIKTEIAHKGYGHRVTAGFLMYPVSQAADITCVRATCVPVGDDQVPLIEQTNEIIHTFNRVYHASFFSPVRALISAVPRLVGIDGKNKMSKSLNNAIYLSDTPDAVKKKVMAMYTDPSHIHVADPGKVEGNTVFLYLDAFDPDKKEVARLKEQYQKGGLGDVVLKKRLIDVLNDFITPIAKKRAHFIAHKDLLISILKESNERVRTTVEKTLEMVKNAMQLTY